MKDMMISSVDMSVKSKYDEAWTNYNNAVIELDKVEKKKEITESKYIEWLAVALDHECDNEMLEVAETMVKPAWEKVVKLNEKVDEAKVKLDKCKAVFVWSGVLGVYLRKTRGLTS